MKKYLFLILFVVVFLYPIKSKADTFGNTGAGASSANIYYNAAFGDRNIAQGSDYTLAGAGTVTKLSVSIKALPTSYTDCTIFSGIFAKGDATTLARNGEGLVLAAVTSTGWKDLTYSTSPSLGADDYKLVALADCDGAGNYTTMTIGYDSSGTNSLTVSSTSGTFTVCPDTLTKDGSGSGVLAYFAGAAGTNKISIYATYTPAAAGGTTPIQDVIFFD